MNKAKIFSLFLVLFLCFVPFVQGASDFILSEYTWTGASANASLGSSYTMVAQTLSFATPGYVTSVTFQLKKVGSPVAFVGCGISNETLTGGTTTFRTNSTTFVQVSTLTGVYQNVTFTFGQDYLIDDAVGVWSIILFWKNTTTIDGSNYIQVSANSAGAYAGGNYKGFVSGSWSDVPTWDLPFQVMANVDAYEEPVTPPEIDPIWDDANVTQLAIYAVALGIILLPLGLLMALRLPLNPFMILIAIGLGAGLGWVLMPTVVPLWLVFVVVIGLIGLAYYTMRR